MRTRLIVKKSNSMTVVDDKEGEWEGGIHHPIDHGMIPGILPRTPYMMIPAAYFLEVAMQIQKAPRLQRPCSTRDPHRLHNTPGGGLLTAMSCVTVVSDFCLQVGVVLLHGSSNVVCARSLLRGVVLSSAYPTSISSHVHAFPSNIRTLLSRPLT